MQTNGSIKNWMFQAPEVLAAIVTAVSITLWSVQTFQSKQDAQETKASLQAEINQVRTEVKSIQSKVDRISENVEYIRGRLEPKSN